VKPNLLIVVSHIVVIFLTWYMVNLGKFFHYRVLFYLVYKFFIK